MAYELGVKTHLSSFPAEALGGLTLGVTPLEMADVYATFADGGLAQRADRDHQGRVPGRARRHELGPAPPRAGCSAKASQRRRRASCTRTSSAGPPARSAINCPTAAKTGTTSELIDAWLDGYTPNYSTVVWMGYPNRRVSMTDVHGEPQQGGYLPAEIWHAYMAAVTEGQPCTEFHEAKEPLSYRPFYGKFATTGQAKQGNEEPETGPGAKPGKSKTKGTTGNSRPAVRTRHRRTAQSDPRTVARSARLPTDRRRRRRLKLRARGDEVPSARPALVV